MIRENDYWRCGACKCRMDLDANPSTYHICLFQAERHVFFFRSHGFNESEALANEVVGALRVLVGTVKS